jgi:hypothetical protein
MILAFRVRDLIGYMLVGICNPDFGYLDLFLDVFIFLYIFIRSHIAYNH